MLPIVIQMNLIEAEDFEFELQTKGTRKAIMERVVKFDKKL